LCAFLLSLFGQVSVFPLVFFPTVTPPAVTAKNVKFTGTSSCAGWLEAAHELPLTGSTQCHWQWQ
jgi:hypothetical protein